VHQAEVGDEDEGASTGPHGQAAIESFMQGPGVAANQMLEKCKDRLCMAEKIASFQGAWRLVDR